jgi:hypothetical protein
VKEIGIPFNNSFKNFAFEPQFYRIGLPILTKLLLIQLVRVSKYWFDEYLEICREYKWEWIWAISCLKRSCRLRHSNGVVGDDSAKR